MNPFYTTVLSQLFGVETAVQVEARLREVVERYRGRIPLPAETSLSERDALLITYPDQVRTVGQPPLQTLADFCREHLEKTVSGIHLLLFYPWSSDDGFSVKDHRRVVPSLGAWQDIEGLGRSFRLMFDAVLNHASVQGDWFQAFLRDEPPWRDYFLTVNGDPDLTKVVRPRALPLLTEFQTTAGRRRVWTTFSADQADLDYHNPEVLLEMVEILLGYAAHGAQFIRLDAVAYLWKEPGSTCINLPQAHLLVRLLHSILNEAAPHVRLVTETNVPHKENIAYFGDGSNEAQLVYNFALPPLVLHTFRTGDASLLSGWAAGLEYPAGGATFFNFLASHDGIGLNPAGGILPASDIEALVAQAILHGGLVSYKQDVDGRQSPYELNINFFDALSDPASPEALETQIRRFMTAQAIMLSLRGVPGIYFHSLFGSRNWREGVRETGSNRAINRQKLERCALEAELADPGSLRAQVVERFRMLLAIRSASSAFHPGGSQEILEAGRGVFALIRSAPNGAGSALCLHNVSAEKQEVSIRNKVHRLRPYETLWSMESPG